MSIKAGSYARFRRALEVGNLKIVLGAAAELPSIGLTDALEILILMARVEDARFERAAVRWIGRLLAETPLSLADARFAIVLVERLPAAAEALRRMAKARAKL